MELLPFVFVVAGAAMLIALHLSHAFTLSSFQRAEDSLSPRIGELVRRDWTLFLANFFIGLFILISFILPFFPTIYSQWVAIFWSFFLAISLILLFLINKKNLEYINPFAIASKFSQQSKLCLKSRQTQECALWIDALSEIVVKALQRTSTTLANKVLKELEVLTADYLTLLKSVGGKNNEEMYYTLGYILERLDFIHSKAIQENLEPISNQIIIIFGKIAFYAAQYDPELAAIPLHFLAKCAKEAQAKGISEANLKASITLQELAKNILDDHEIREKGIRLPLLALINHLEDIAKTTFKTDKSTSILVLMQPFQDLKAILQSESYITNPDSEYIIRDLDRILGEFDALSMILKTVPNIPGFEKKEEQEEGT